MRLPITFLEAGFVTWGALEGSVAVRIVNATKEQKGHLLGGGFVGLGSSSKPWPGSSSSIIGAGERLWACFLGAGSASTDGVDVRLWIRFLGGACSSSSGYS